MKTLALDIGDVWVGSALSDGAGITCRPYQTVTLPELHTWLEELLEKEQIGTIVVGHPITVGGTVSKQTEIVEKIFGELKNRFTQVEWVLRDERFSSKRAADIMKGGAKEKKQEHSIAAAFILQSYLDYCASQRE